MRFLNVIVLAAMGLASAALAAPAPEVPTVTLNIALPTSTAVMIDKRAKTTTSCTSKKTSTSCTSTKKTSTTCTLTKKTTTSCTKTPTVKTTTSCTSSKKATTAAPKVQMAKIAATTTTTICQNTISVPFPSMDPGTYTVFASTAIFTKMILCTKGCLVKIATADNTYPEPTKTVSAEVTTRTVHACSSTIEAKKWKG